MKYKQYDDTVHISCILCKKEATFLLSGYCRQRQSTGVYLHTCPHCNLAAEIELEVMISEVWFREIIVAKEKEKHEKHF
ncbi:hypothetical protein JHD46_08565 [Sulfurimonas sp. SAG-AH-194-C20]|nr:hypothetical protein [Sulfurimonas sp. SAG-AH-194-C20]MDF1879688.1 hypothetical protein [Sulfurimonas sp. SAG-AH-194-C20]